MIGGFDQLVETGLADAQFREKECFLLIFQFGYFLLDFGADDDDLSFFCCGELTDGLYIFIASVVCRVVFRNVGHIDDRFVGEQIQAFDEVGFFFGQLHGSGGFSRCKEIVDAVQQINFLLQRFVSL